MAENILHFGGIRLRVNGSGNLDLKWIGLDDVKTETLVPIVMAVSPGKQPLRLSNFKGQRARLKISINAIDEYFVVNRIVLYMKELYTGYPQ